MDLRFAFARMLGAASTQVLKTVFRRPAANFPGKVGLYADPNLIAQLKTRIAEGTFVIVGTNGKTTVSNLLADVLEAAGKTVCCNRTGANLDSGIATALLHTKQADWGVFECDELWLAKVAPQLQPDYIVVLNLFRDQLDRAGEIEHVQESIICALDSCPETTLLYNADDPFCQAIANRSRNETIAFGIDESMELPQNAVADSGLCQQCDSMLVYDWRQYGQLGKYHCDTCGFSRCDPKYRATNICISQDGMSFTFQGPQDPETPGHNSPSEKQVKTSLTGAYQVYNLLALCAAADCCNSAFAHVEEAIRNFAPQNGRFQSYEIDGCHILLNLAKNPTGFNQNLRIIMDASGPKAVAFFINDKEADGHDVSWLWDVDFQDLAKDQNIVAYAGGIRKNDMQVRLKYAGIKAQLVDSAQDFLMKAQSDSPDANVYLIANYTALPSAKAELDRMHHLPLADPETIRGGTTTSSSSGIDANLPCGRDPAHGSMSNRRLVIAHLYPELLNLYGDGGNVTVLADRARGRGMEAEVLRVSIGQPFDFSQADIVFIGGGPDREQVIASHHLMRRAGELKDYVEDDGVVLAICGGYQIIGRTWIVGDEEVPGLGIVDIETGRAPGGSHNRLVDNIALSSELSDTPVIGYENHAGRTFLGEGVRPFGRVIGNHGSGNNDESRSDGVLYRNVLGTYLHGPLLAKNPQVADWLLARALERRARKNGEPTPVLAALDDAEELAANANMCSRLGVRL